MATGRIMIRNGVRYLDISNGFDENGKRRRIQRKTKKQTKSGANEELQEELYILNRAGRHGGATDNEYLITRLVEDWLENQKMRVSPETFETYNAWLVRLLKSLKRQKCLSVSRLTPKVILNYQKESQEAGLSNRSINVAQEKLSAAIDLGIKYKLIASNPLKDIDRLPPKKKKIRRDLTPEEAAMLLEVSTEHYHRIWLFLLSTGTRTAEAANLQWKDIDLEQGIVYIRTKKDWTPKTAAGIRTIPITGKILENLKTYKAARKAKESEYVFVTADGEGRRQKYTEAFKRMMRRALKRLRKIPDGKNLKNKEREKHAEDLEDIEHELTLLDVHSLRYTFITELIASGTDPKTVQRLAGHEDIQTTLGIYAQCRKGNDENAIAKLPWN